MLIDAENSLLLVVDVQERLLPAVCDPQAVLRNVAILIEAARRLDIPVIATEQNPEGLGHTVAALAGRLPDGCIVKKTHFAAGSEPEFGERIAEAGRSHILICGAEAHVCVLQTATELQALPDRQVFLVADATASRTAENHRLALERLARNGAEILSTEMAVFEWLRHSDRPEFRDLLALVR
ncbi:MAG: isochorismatase family protein [Alphaproteobacteria bacterium]|nr:isochorismatase family protein [Alphaproteobacteria bacterium]